MPQSFNLGNALTTIAPTLAAMLGGPLAGTAVAALESALNLSPGVGEAGITNVIQSGMSPEAVANIRLADQAHAEHLKQMGIDVLKMNVDFQTAIVQADTTNQVSARSMQVAAPSVWPGTLTLLLTSMMGGLVGTYIYASYIKMPMPTDPAFVALVAGLPSAWMLSLTYWFGTNRQNHNMQNSLAQSMPANGGAQ